MLLDRSFYERSDVTLIARELLGKRLNTKVDGITTSGIIVETEAYNGRNDKACHAFLKRTKRTEIMYGVGGVAYVYLCYGIHHLFNIVTNVNGMADAVLIRAIEPDNGLISMEERRGIDKDSTQLTSGPGKLSKALGITTSDYGSDLTTGERIWLEEGLVPDSVVETTRIGIDYAEEDKLLPWRYYIRGNKWVSKL